MSVPAAVASLATWTAELVGALVDEQDRAELRFETYYDTAHRCYSFTVRAPDRAMGGLLGTQCRTIGAIRTLLRVRRQAIGCTDAVDVRIVTPDWRPLASLVATR